MPTQDPEQPALEESPELLYLLQTLADGDVQVILRNPITGEEKLLIRIGTSVYVIIGHATGAH